ncbi:MAG: gliding motility-associated C-terminal domain-containing protein [Bacteroidales bacterium]|nr:gliding motility-associated C-terminal domain-containing protein [Bacteroidales bacterium]
MTATQKAIQKAWTWVAAGMVLLWPCAAMGQELVSFNVPHEMCAGTTVEVSFGYSSTNNVVVRPYQASMGHSEQIFLPDGQNCGSSGCAYNSPVTFTGFPDGLTVSSVQDIKYVRLNMEHSYIGDLYIGLRCPNGQKAAILKYSDQNSGGSPCLSAIPNSSRGYAAPQTQNNHRAYLGLPNTTDNNNFICDSSRNSPGTGWDYCWSNNTTSNYSYAANGGYIYRTANQVTVSTSRSRVKASNVNNGTNFYHPDQNFSSLVGCPLNGVWNIEVIDGWSTDNGYIFEWELALDPTLIPSLNCVPVRYIIEGYGVTELTDSTFSITAPSHVTHDSTVTYIYTVISSCGDTIVRTANLVFHPTVDTTLFFQGCEFYSWQHHTYTSDTLMLISDTTSHGCDSTVHVDIDIHPVFRLDFTDTVVENALPYSIFGRTFLTEVKDSLLADTTAYGCDSSVVFSLAVHWNSLSNYQMTLCDDALPVLWNGLFLVHSCDTAISYHDRYGADSVVALSLTVNPTHSRSVVAEAVENELPVFYLGTPFYASVDTTAVYSNAYGCDSTVHLTLSVHFNHPYRYSKTLCDDRLPFLWHGETFTKADTVELELYDHYGADSTVVLILNVNPTFQSSLDTAICDNQYIIVGNQSIAEAGLHTVSLLSAEGCDSTVTVFLTVNPTFQTHVHDTTCANDSYSFGNQTFSQSGNYSYPFVNAFGCDSIITLHLNIIGQDLEAQIKAVPTLVTPADPNYALYDQSRNHTARLWLIDGMSYSSDRNLALTFPLESDSVDVRLVAFNADGCTDTAQTAIHIDRFTLFTPNAITPSLESNNRWQPIATDIVYLEVWIYNREGLLVAHLEGIDAYWDGTHNGVPCPQGAYIYNMKYRSRWHPDRMQDQTGSILLIR